MLCYKCHQPVEPTTSICQSCGATVIGQNAPPSTLITTTQSIGSQIGVWIAVAAAVLLIGLAIFFFIRSQMGNQNTTTEMTDEERELIVKHTQPSNSIPALPDGASCTPLGEERKNQIIDGLRKAVLDPASDQQKESTRQFFSTIWGCENMYPEQAADDIIIPLVSVEEFTAAWDYAIAEQVANRGQYCRADSPDRLEAAIRNDLANYKSLTIYGKTLIMKGLEDNKITQIEKYYTDNDIEFIPGVGYSFCD